MSCERMQAAHSARLDGEVLTPRTTAELDQHLAGCARCATFARRSERVRTAVRIRPAEPVPDLIGSTMERIRLEAPRSPRAIRALPWWPGRARRSWTPRAVAPVAAALVVGLVAGSLVVGGPWRSAERTPLAAAAVIRDVRARAAALTSYDATFAIVEHGLAPTIPRRELTMRVAYLAPQRFRLDVTDRTAYPSSAWTPTDLTFIQDGGRTYRAGPTGCPAELSPGGCPATRATLTDRGAAGAAIPPAAELVLPLATFDASAGITVMGEERLGGRDAVRVRLSFARAAPLFPFLRLGGTWRPFFDRDRVDVWLDASSWSPVRWRVSASAATDRRDWELRFGLPEEPPGAPLLDVRATSTATVAPDPAAFALPGGPVGSGLSLAEVRARLGHAPATLPDPGALRLAAASTPETAGGDGPDSVLLYLDGLSYVRIGERTGWSGPELFGPVDATAERVAVGDGIAYYEPAGDGLGRRLAIHADGTDLYVESNLPRTRLLALAATLPVMGRDAPTPWLVRTGTGSRIERVEPDRVAALAPFAVPAPPALPAGYVPASAQLEREEGVVVGVTVLYRQRESDLAGGPLFLHVEPGRGLPPTTSSARYRVDAGGIDARWTPARSLLEWEHGGVYASLTGALPLSTLLGIVRGIVLA